MASVSSSAPRLGARNTRQRTAVVELMKDLDNFASAKDIHHELSERNEKVGLTTVYRTLQSLAEISAVDVLHMASGETLYRACQTDRHHHHLVCTECGRTEEIDGGPVEEWARKVADQYGFELSTHDAEIYGICPECRDRPSDRTSA
ncbi:Fur family transcriptional regulator [Corynebacterium guangdongense]|uniref:Fur family ferric uptake transcriptional regulator n=1 Tax=Corynebacterium guangdongense TaxID=1783348 RepID=A0ABU1ZYE8_9CORY|nr:Fur family transcriptional regulator [Corynebacterium guangdongense]MDR7329964.1 Fur family ferric uptake transcriptional regulator [Corynebacterium guangdongense]